MDKPYEEYMKTDKKKFVSSFFQEVIDERLFYFKEAKESFKPAQIAGYEGTSQEYFDDMVGSMMAWAYKKGKEKK